jgi:hypothetical protein
MKRRALMLSLLLAPLVASAGRLVRGSRSAAAPGDELTTAALPSGSLSFTVTWQDITGESGIMVYVSTTPQQHADPSLYAYRYPAAADATSLAINSVQAGTKYVRIAGHDGTYAGPLSAEFEYTPA